MSRKLNDALEGRYIKKVFQEEGQEFIQDQDKKMRSRGFSSQDWSSGRSMTASETSLVYMHPFKMRAVDMRHHTTKDGKRYRRKAHPIHNRMLYGRANDIINKLRYGFTEAVKEEMRTVNLGL